VKQSAWAEDRRPDGRPFGEGGAAAFAGPHELITAGRTSGDVRVNLASEASIEAMFQQLGAVDACICTAGTGCYGNFHTMRQADLMAGIKGKLLGQVI
jgi:NAD(P)-dependent dehydrogenase (short-subunit alcohol dehydrogenase family)